MAHRSAALLLAAVACAAPPPDDTTELVRATDTDPDPHVVSIELHAGVTTWEYLPGKKTDAWAYDGRVPGPVIEANVGDRLVVRFTNDLPEPTTIHWHGARVPAAMDGVPHMMDPVPAGGTFTYEFELKDEGLLWFHPHVRTDIQVGRGLYGLLLVHDPADTVPSTVPERLLVIDDALLDDAGKALESLSHSAAMMGREGNVMLVNGRSDAVLRMQPGRWERWRVLDAANARYFSLESDALEFVQVGSDGGVWAEFEHPSTIPLVPGERADLFVRLKAGAPATSALRTGAVDRGHHVVVSPRTLATILSDGAPVPDAAPPLPAAKPMPRPQAAAVIRTLSFTEVEQPDMSVTFRINGESWPDVTPLDATLGTTETWLLDNQTEMDHPFHLHGFRFIPSSVGPHTMPRRYRDTVNVPAGTQVRVSPVFDGFAGAFMFHCHILEHAEAGMMGVVEVSEPLP